jgi:hypothetical protein
LVHSRYDRGRRGCFLAEASAQCPLLLEEESYNRGVRGMTQLIWHLAVFLGGLPSRGQEIDDKLLSDSS